MKIPKVTGKLLPFASLVLLLSSCSKNMGDQLDKDLNNTEAKNGEVPSCSPFVGIQTRQNDPVNSYVFYGDHKTPIAKELFYGSSFGSNLICFSATGGSPYYHAQYIRIGVGNQWIDANETLSLKLCGDLAGKAANGFQMLLKSADGVGKAEFYLQGVYVGETAINGVGIMEPFLSYQSAGQVFDFDEVKFVVTSGKLALTGFTPNNVTPGPGGFFLVEHAGSAASLVLAKGTKNIGGTEYPNQFITYTNNYTPVPSAQRQNRVTGIADDALGSGEFPPYVIPGSKHWLNVTGSGPLVFRGQSSFRLGVNDLFFDGEEYITITPGVDFPSANFRSVSVREAVAPNTVGDARLLIRCVKGATVVASAISAGVDQSFTHINSLVEFDRVVISKYSSNGLNKPSIGRPTPGPLAGAIKLYPGCNNGGF